jgi:hypothetical protein
MSGIAKAIEPITAFAKAVNPIVGLALTAASLYGTYKALGAAKETVTQTDQIADEKASFERQLQYSEEARDMADRDNRARRIYNHLGALPPGNAPPDLKPGRIPDLT